MGREIGYRWRRGIPLGVGGAAAALVFIMALAPAGLGAHAPSVTVVAPFHGVSGKFAFTEINGCAAFKGSAKFSLTTGVGSAMATASAKSCPGNLAGVNLDSYADTDNEATSAIKLTLPTGSHTVNTTWKVGWTTSGGWATTGICPTTPFHDTYNYSTATYAYWDNYTGYSGYCSTYASAYGGVYSYLEDITTGTYFYASNSMTGSFYTENYSDHGFEWYHDTTWTSSSGYSYSNGTYSSNYTGQYSYNGTYCYGNTCPTSWTGSFSGGNLVFTSAAGFNRLHHYALVVEIYGEVDTSVDGWAHGLATANFNMATSPNGATLSSIVIS
ncbi:MAG TPA: hypothetical protein VGV89_09915 [Thermoplasmata archaeon]|nr:hypothetical protein [Thermoplasmata archaeon]